MPESGFYIGLNAGLSNADLDEEALDQAVLAAFDIAGITVVDGVSSVDDPDTSISLVAGYRFSRHFAIEASYLDAGEMTYQASGSAVIPPFASVAADTRVSAEATGFTLSAIGSWPISQRWELFGRAGLFFANTKYRFGVSLADVSEGFSESDSSQEILFGVGVGAHLTDRWSLRAQFTRLTDVGDEDTFGESDVDIASLEVTYSF